VEWWCSLAVAVLSSSSFPMCILSLVELYSSCSVVPLSVVDLSVGSLFFLNTKLVRHNLEKMGCRKRLNYMYMK
jgi:hypothetical protein